MQEKKSNDEWKLMTTKNEKKMGIQTKEKYLNPFVWGITVHVYNFSITNDNVAH